MEKKMFIKHYFSFPIQIECLNEVEGPELLKPTLEKIEWFCKLFGATYTKDLFWKTSENMPHIPDNIIGYSVIVVRSGVLGELRAFSDAMRAFCEFQNLPRPKERLELVTEVYTGK